MLALLFLCVVRICCEFFRSRSDSFRRRCRVFVCSPRIVGVLITWYCAPFAVLLGCPPSSLSTCTRSSCFLASGVRRRCVRGYYAGSWLCVPESGLYAFLKTALSSTRCFFPGKCFFCSACQSLFGGLILAPVFSSFVMPPVCFPGCRCDVVVWIVPPHTCVAV